MLSRVEIKCVVKHLLKSFAWSVHLLLNPAQEKTINMMRDGIFPTKSSKDILKFWSQFITRPIQGRTMSCTLNFIWMRHPGTENTLLCPENLTHHEVSFAHHRSIWAVGTFIFHFWIASETKIKYAIKPHKSLWTWYIRLWCEGRASRKPVRNFPVGLRLETSGGSTIVQQLNHKTGHHLGTNLALSELISLTFSQTFQAQGPPFGPQIPMNLKLSMEM